MKSNLVRTAAWLMPLLVQLTAVTVNAQEPECVDGWPNPDGCFPDVLCNQYEAYWDYRRAVVHLDGPDFLGTGVLINNAECHEQGTSCGKPYILTANHIISGGIGVEMSDGEKADLEDLTAFTFGLEAGVCFGETTDGAVALVGASVIGYDVDRDLVLVQLDTSLPSELGAYHVGWESGGFDQGVSISHPCGAPKRIAISEFGDVVFQQTLNRKVYDVYYWQEGALASGSSGAPLLDVADGALKGIYTDAVGQGAAACFQPNLAAQDRFTAISDILEFIPTSIDGGLLSVGHFDAGEGGPLAGTVEDANYYGDGEVREITARTQVLLIDGFFADKGSTVNVRIEP